MASPMGGTIRPLENKPRKHCRRWKLRVRTGLNPRTGKYSERTRNVTGSWTEACKALEAFAGEVERGTGKPGRKMTFCELWAEYAAHREAMGDLAQSTLKAMRGFGSSLSMHLGAMPAHKLQPYMVEEAYKSLMAGDSPKGRKVGGASIRTMASWGARVYDYAIERGISESNPFRDAQKPKGDVAERMPPTEEQTRRLISFMDYSDGRHAAVVLGTMAGLRLGECLALEWHHVDLLEGTMDVPGTKTKGSRATIPMCADLVAWLLGWKESQASMLAAKSIAQSDDTAVASTELGRHMTDAAFQGWWHRSRKSFGLSNARFHDLRHGWATLLVRSGANAKAVQHLMRHATVRTTMGIYAHTDMGDMRDAVSKVSFRGPN